MQHTISRLFIALIVGASLLMAGCGFHLRGKITVPDYLMRMHIKGDDVQLIERTQKGLEFSDVLIMDEAKGIAVLDMSDTVYEKELTVATATGLAKSYKLNYTVNYEVLDPEGKLIQKHILEQKRVLPYDPANILLFEREETFLKEDMQKELVSQLLRRLSKISK